MTTKRFNAPTILNSNLMGIGNAFISKNDERFRQFGRFTKEDFN